MRKLSFMFLMLIILLAAAPLYAQTDAAAPAKSWAVPIGVGLGMGLAAGLAGLGQGKVAGAVAEALARNPGARPGIQLALFIGLAFIESLVLFTFVLLFIRT
ncbi:MAG TPA: ATP synthase F0 subunit C [Candidatus Saccharimonadales bacterium]|jgi:F-type H+-transporting ATPase subunit c|nr:ATP synthase F0 subunit C [Candidatus Saccharimonadales bacterium]